MVNVKSLDGQRRRGRRAVIAGAFLIVVVSGVWVWLVRFFAGHSAAQADPSSMQMLGRLNVAYGLMVIAGLLGIANGWLMMQSGRGHKGLVLALVIVAIGAFVTAVFA